MVNTQPTLVAYRHFSCFVSKNKDGSEGTVKNFKYNEVIPAKIVDQADVFWILQFEDGKAMVEKKEILIYEQGVLSSSRGMVFV